jgi:hypothetical protein
LFTTILHRCQRTLRHAANRSDRSAWADGFLIASVSCIARLNKQQQLHCAVDLERSAADTLHASFIAESCDGVRLLLLLLLLL